MFRIHVINILFSRNDRTAIDGQLKWYIKQHMQTIIISSLPKPFEYDTFVKYDQKFI